LISSPFWPDRREAPLLHDELLHEIEEENGILEWISNQRGSLIQGEFKEMTHPRAHCLQD